jgi:hypothetical protein
MRIAIVAVAILALAAAAYAINPENDRGTPPPENPFDGHSSRTLFHCQDPTSSYSTTNASTGFESEFADDIPAELDGMFVGQIVVYIGEWGGTGWVDPAGIIVNLYNEDCPPDMGPYETLYFNWGDANQMEYEFVNDTGTSFDLRVTLFLGNMIQIQSPMSIGFVVDNTWGTEPPYCGVDYSSSVYGCGIGYYDHTYWGEPRWTSYNDVAYCLDDEGVVATESSTWSAVKHLYR